jgi:hypothetical protein
MSFVKPLVKIRDYRIDPGAYFPDFGEAAGLATGLLAG